MTISFRSAAEGSLIPSLFSAAAGEAMRRVCGHVGSIALACAAGQRPTAISNAGDTAQRTLRRSTRRIPHRPLVVRGADVPEAFLSDRAGTSLLRCIRSLCGTKPEGFRHRAYIIAPAADACREIFPNG